METQTTLRETLEKQFSEAEELDTPIADVTPQESEPTPLESKESRDRDEKGRFAKGETKAEVVPTPEQTKDISLEPALPQIQRPTSWKKEMWPLWDKLTTGAPLNAQEARQLAEYNSQREQQFASGVSTYKQEAERAKPILEAIAPFQQELDSYKVNTPQMVHSLLQAHRTLALGSASEKLNLFNKLANDYGIPLAALYDQNTQQQYLASAPQPQYQPQQQPDINKVIEDALSAREVKQTITSMETNHEKYPFFQYVRNTMAQLLETGAATDLESAYELSLNDPQHSMLSTVMQQQQTQADEQRKIAEKQDIAKKARANQISVKSATPMTTGATKGNPSVREALQEAIDQHLGSARV